MIQEKIKNLIRDALENLDVKVTAISLEHPEDLKNGDYSTNLAMVCAKTLKENPKELANKIVAEILRLNADENIKKEPSIHLFLGAVAIVLLIIMMIWQ